LVLLLEQAWLDCAALERATKVIPSSAFYARNNVSRLSRYGICRIPLWLIADVGFPAKR
jgi:hypothetical protein